MEIVGILVLILSFVFLLLIGVPIAFCIGISTLLTMLVSIPFDPAITTVAQRMATGLDSFALLAIPFFILAGQIMNQGGIARRLIDFAKSVVGMLPGGLAYVQIIAAMLFASISGSAVATASAIGGFMGPQMKKEGYDIEFTTALNITSSTTGLIIPPSNILIVYSLASGGASIAALFLAGYLPGILVGLSLMFVSGYFAIKRKYPISGKVPLSVAFRKFIDALPSLFLVILVIGGIVAGIFTATEASAIAVVYALILSFFYKGVNIKELKEVFLSSCNVTAIVALLIATSMAMSWIMSYENIPVIISESLIALSDNPFIILIIINIILLGVGIFMDMTPAVLIFTPIFLPLVVEMGIDPVHFGIIMILNLCIGACTPPVGSVLFVGCGISNISITRVIKPLIPLFIAMIISLLIVTYVPEITMFLPDLFGY
ncbi:TRAP transporter large permease [Rhodohalobacter sulfatireducens]|uniref:TRAP transporter large permease subunit n=1 Tax=Rhodohalobacter sulfatireducens TaxID=2911366 RepID=A0ABS9KHG8_9BACT|nr:TRAP transporter large permease subunit [Rhodohalobacter sulfatireducens]MCG2590297.1 TRAP transporter large permease subunit [Rhodohalobacter sulfatireducens]